MDQRQAPLNISTAFKMEGFRCEFYHSHLKSISTPEEGCTAETLCNKAVFKKKKNIPSKAMMEEKDENEQEDKNHFGIPSTRVTLAPPISLTEYYFTNNVNNNNITNKQTCEGIMK